MVLSTSSFKEYYVHKGLLPLLERHENCMATSPDCMEYMAEWWDPTFEFLPQWHAKCVAQQCYFAVKHSPCSSKSLSIVVSKAWMLQSITLDWSLSQVQRNPCGKLQLHPKKTVVVSFPTTPVFRYSLWRCIIEEVLHHRLTHGFRVLMVHPHFICSHNDLKKCLNAMQILSFWASIPVMST
jgi:hypothetical protein